jgi:hypothetical protein
MNIHVSRKPVAKRAHGIRSSGEMQSLELNSHPGTDSHELEEWLEAESEVLEPEVNPIRRMPTRGSVGKRRRGFRHSARRRAK